MSLVGTRPPTVDEWDKYELHHRARLATKPGLTGMWQVSGRSNITDFIYMHAERAENVYELTQLVAEEYEIEPAEILEDVRNVVLTLQKKGILL